MLNISTIEPINTQIKQDFNTNINKVYRQSLYDSIKWLCRNNILNDIIYRFKIYGVIM